VALKVLKESKGDGEEFMNEVASISRTSHVNVVTLLSFCYERNKRALIYEFMPNGSLDSFISVKGSPHTNCRLEWKKLYEIAVGIARGLEYLHRGCNTRIVHFDMKPHNILLDDEFCPKISDFGLAKLCQSKVSKISMIGARGTVGYIAPEVFCRSFGGVTYKSDVYSYGMMVLEMVGQSKDFDMGSLETNEMYFPDWFYMYLEPGKISTLHGGITEEEEEIVEKMILVGLWCIQTIPSHRPSMTKVVEMLEGSLQSLQIPPRPYLSSPRRSAQDHSSTISSLPCMSSQGDGVNTLSADESDL
jgi:interleukin-1 receptor-associated kinase 1